MNVQRQIARLESLLSRIQRNATKPRGAAAAAHPSPLAQAPSAVEAGPDSGPPTDRTDAGFAQPPAPPAVVESPVVEAAVEVVELEMSDDDMVEIAVESPVDDFAVAEAPAAGPEPTPQEERAAPLANELAEEPAPESAPRPAAQAAEEADLEPPVKTPPPESGRQVVAAPSGIGGEAEFHEPSGVTSFEADLSGAAISQAPANEPSAAQLGETVELEGASEPAARIELLSAPMGVPDPAAEIPADELELSLPQRQYGGGYDQDLAPPSRASEDLARHRGQSERDQHPPTQPPVSLATPPSMDFAESSGGAAAPAPAVEAASPVVVARPSVGDVQIAEMRKSTAAQLPSTFLELLDASLSIEA